MRSFFVGCVMAVAAVTLSGCMLESASGTTSGAIQGPVVGAPVTGTFSASVVSGGMAHECTQTTLSVRLTDLAGNTVTMQDAGQMCPDPSFAAWRFSGLYSVSGGTGRYEGATGAGIASLFFVATPKVFTFAATEIGTFVMPGTASAASVRKRTFKSHGTIGAAKVCKPTRKPSTSTRQKCKTVSVEKLLG